MKKEKIAGWIGIIAVIIVAIILILKIKGLI